MSWFRRMLDGVSSIHRRARSAEGAGEWRRAAALWAEANEPARAAEALIHLAQREGTLEARLAAWQDALMWIGDEDDMRREFVERSMSVAVLEDARLRGAASAEEKRRLADAASRLEGLGDDGRAAEAFGILGRREDQARCLEAAGEIEALEALLGAEGRREEKADQLRRLVSHYEMAMQYGARLEARGSLREAVRISDGDASAEELLRRLEARMPPPFRVRLEVAGQAVTFVGRMPAVIGRGDVDVRVRGTSVSREHTEVALRGGRAYVADKGSRNGTLVGGVPIAGELELGGPTELGLGDDVRLEVTPSGATIGIDVLSGFDRGERFRLGEGTLMVEGTAARLSFPEGWALLSAEGAELTLDGRACTMGVHLLSGDQLVVGGIPLRVLA
ncbi:MAG: FHA domain-containing protein [Sandaracinaceae bacterium]